MKTLPLAVYTADHGLAWAYPKDEIGFAEIDACRKAFGPLPDFDAGAKGFCGIWAVGDRIFAMRCQSVAAWDFRGRNATYLAVTWLPRSEAATTDFERLLVCDELCKPTKNPPAFFELDADCREIQACAPEAVLRDGFSRIGGIIAGVPADRQVFAKRTGETESASCTVLDSMKTESAEKIADSGMADSEMIAAGSKTEQQWVSGRTKALPTPVVLAAVAMLGWMLAIVLLTKVWTLSAENAAMRERHRHQHGKEGLTQMLR